MTRNSSKKLSNPVHGVLSRGVSLELVLRGGVMTPMLNKLPNIKSLVLWEFKLIYNFCGRVLENMITFSKTGIAAQFSVKWQNFSCS